MMRSIAALFVSALLGGYAEAGGPLAELRTAPGPHIAKVEALGMIRS